MSASMKLFNYVLFEMLA